MELTTAIKISGVVVAAATATTGSVFLYKHITGLYSVEKVAAYANQEWTISDAVKVENSDDKLWKVDISLSSVNDTDYKVTDGSWVCTVVGAAAEKSTVIDDSAIDKAALKEQIYNKVKKSGETDTNKENRIKFVNSCSINRKQQEQTNNVVSSEIKLDLKKDGDKWKFDEDQMAQVFSGIWRNK